MDRKQIEEKIIRQWKAKYQELIHENKSAQEKVKTMKKKLFRIEGHTAKNKKTIWEI